MSSMRMASQVLNRALRATVEATDYLSENLPPQDRVAALTHAAQALASLSEALNVILRTDPSLEYHYDQNRPPTPFMKEVGALSKRAEAFVTQGAFGDAVQALEAALALEPPPFTYQQLAKRLREVKGERS